MARTILPFIALCILLLWTSCKPKEEATPAPPIDFVDGRMWIICEGSLGNGNGSLDLYRKYVDSFYSNVFTQVNGQPVGDVFQSMTRIGDRYLLCVNNSDKVLAIRRSDFRLDGMMTIPKPRYILRVSDEEAYVSTLFSNQVFVFNPQTLTVTDTITLPAQNPEGMLLVGNRAYICAWDTAANQVFVVNTTTHAIEDTVLTAGRAPQEIGQDNRGRLWILAGNVAKGKTATLTCVDGNTHTTIKSFSFPAGADPLRLEWNAARDTLYFIGVNYNGGTAYNGVFRMGVEDNALPTQPFIPAQPLQYFWGLGIEPVTGRIIVGDPKGFIQRGEVRFYNQQGQLQKTLTTGVGPGHFYFDYP